jgi:hypothetical protein
MNYVDDKYIIDILPDVLRGIPDQRLKIQFPSGQLFPPGVYPETLLKSIGYYVQGYADQMKREGVDPATLRQTEIVIYGDLYGMHCRAEAEDDRGKHYKVEIK